MYMEEEDLVCKWERGRGKWGGGGRRGTAFSMLESYEIRCNCVWKWLIIVQYGCVK